MSGSNLWRRYQAWFYYDADLDIGVDISRTAVNEAAVKLLAPLFDHAFARMAELEAGAIANPDEQRMVGHYWLRDSALAPDARLKDEIDATVAAVKGFADQVHEGRLSAGGTSFTDVLCIGIGGSALGPQFVADALAPRPQRLAMHFIDNTDPDGIDRVMATLAPRLATTLVVVTSKSGGTPETRNGMLEARAAMERAGLDFPAQAVAITGEDSQLDKLANAEGWLARFPMHDWVGGRTSELSVVGLLPAALQGIDIDALLEGARVMDKTTRVADIRNNPAALLALSWHVAGDGIGARDMVVLPYKDSLLLFSRYLQQLVMESLGKSHDLDGRTVHQGLAVYGNKGSTDQHAYVQQLRDGLDNFFATFIEVLSDREGPSAELDDGATAGDYLSGFLAGTRAALYENGRQSITITLPGVDPLRVGAMIALYERAVGLYASLVNINAYHQPGVEAGKQAAASVLALQQRLLAALDQQDAPVDIETLAALADAPDDPESVHSILRHLAANHRGVVIHGDRGQPGALKVSRQPRE